MKLMDKTDKKENIKTPIVSFCIATFQRYEILKEMIQEILSVKTDKIEIVVCDNQSQDGSVEKLKKIKDSRLKVYVNEENVGSALNVHDSLDRGIGKYLFYANDRDNIDFFKVNKLIEILEELEKESVAFARCYGAYNNVEKYQIFNKGKDAMIQFACRIDHPTGYIFKRDIWKRIKNRRSLFENQNYGDYPITQVCAIMAKQYKGALIYGDICDLKRQRIDFSKEKSRYYEKRKDKRLWYTPDVIFREIKIGQKFLKKNGIKKDTRHQIMIDRYTEYLSWCVTEYKNKITDPVCTTHYNIYPHQDFFHVFIASILNGIKLWIKILLLCFAEDKQLISEINKITLKEYVNYFKHVLKDELYLKGKKTKKIEEKNYEIVKREHILDIYESWINALIDEKRISEYFLKHGYYHVAIYGMGRIGKQLYREFQNANITVDFIIDQKMSKWTQYYENIPCLNIESEFPCTDIIIVTVSMDVDEIINNLRKKVREPIKSMNDILFVLEK